MRNVIPIGSRYPSPPFDLNEAEEAKWDELVRTQSPKWWTQQRLEALAEFCRVIELCKQAHNAFERCDPHADYERFHEAHNLWCYLSEKQVESYEAVGFQ